MRIAAIIVIYLCLLAVCSCGSDSKTHALLEEIDRLCDSVPEEAIGILDTIDQSGLSEKDLNRLRLLWIKSRDKAYIAHTSDTLILDVVDYYSSHRSEGLYPEALYYGGRVYSDIGDLPTALEFFQKSLDEIPENDAHLRFKATVLDQTGRLLHTLRLDSAALEYLEMALMIRDKIRKGNDNDSFTHDLIATSLRRLNRFKEARRHMDEAVKISSKLKEDDKLTVLAQFADMLYQENKIDSALMIIQTLPNTVDSITLPYCLGLAAEIYKEAGILDTAYKYARQLTKLSAPNNKTSGYRVIFSEKMRKHVHKDTLIKLMPEYKQSVEDYLDSHHAEQALIQNAHYNYSGHVKQRLQSENRLRSLKEKVWVVGGSLIILGLIAVSILLWRKYHKSKKDSQVMEGIILTDRLKENNDQFLEEVDAGMEQKKEDRQTGLPYKEKNRILDEIRREREENPAAAVDKALKASPLYKRLKEKAELKKVMGKDITWTMIEDLIESVSPGFDTRLTILTEGRITSAERNVARLMKCGFSQIQMASLMARSESTISAQRKSLASKIGYEKSVIVSIIVRL